jgi:hypothetical protein
VRLLLLSAAALAGFAANSLLTRGALATARLDPASFSLIRVVTGAIALGLLTRARRPPTTGSIPSWLGAWSLAGYVVAFTLAYTRIGASVGALLLFGSVGAMIGRIARGGGRRSPTARRRPALAGSCG